MYRTPPPGSRPAQSPYLPSGSLLGKRGASEAGIDVDPSVLQKSNRDLQNRNDTLSRRLKSSQDSERRLEKERQQLNDEIAVLRQNRASLVDKSTADGSLTESRQKVLEEDNAKLTQQLSAMRTRSNKTRDENERLHSEISQLNNKVSNLEQISKPLAGLEEQIKDLRAQNQELQGWRKRAESLSISLLEEQRKIRTKSQDTRDNEEDQRGEIMYKEELSRQKQHLSSLNSKLHQVEAENTQLKESKREWEESRRSYVRKEQDLRDQIHVLNDQLERARHDMDSMTQSFPSSDTPSESAATLQAKLSSLSQLHQEATTELANKKVEITKLYARLSDSTNAAQVTISQLGKEKTELERSLRWAVQGRDSAEKGEAMAKRELESYTQFHDTPQGMPGGLGSDQSGRVRQLEQLVKEYKAELESQSRDSRDLEEKIAQGQGLVKASLLDEAQSQISSLQTQIGSFESTLAELQSANTTLDAEVNDLMRRVASGEYNPKTERVIELRNNPASRIAAIRNQAFETLKAENAALIKAGGGSARDGSVPRESWERLSKAHEDLKASHEKRLLRLKEIFALKSKEFLEAVYSLLGWRIKFDESGTDFRLTSMYAPKGKMGLTLKFTSQEGHFGTMTMSGGMARGGELEECRRFWIEERQSVPGFLAQVTTEMFEKTTMGRGAGYVGLE